MINLLPPQVKEDIKAARTNVVLVRYMAILGVAALFILAIVAYSYVTMTATEANIKQVITANDTKSDVYSSTQQEVDALSSQLLDAKALLAGETRYSKLLLSIGSAMPAGTVLEKIELKQDSIGGAPIIVKAFAKNSSVAATLQQQLRSSPYIQTVGVQSTNESSGIDGYPISISLSISLKKGVN